MFRPQITKEQALMMIELCLDAEERCHERILAARENGDFRTAAFEVQLKEQYESLKARLYEELKYSSSATTQDLQAILARLRRSAHAFAGAEFETGDPASP